MSMAGREVNVSITPEPRTQMELTENGNNLHYIGVIISLEVQHESLKILDCLGGTMCLNGSHERRHNTPELLSTQELWLDVLCGATNWKGEPQDCGRQNQRLKTQRTVCGCRPSAKRRKAT
jgi:hypothetical protein